MSSTRTRWAATSKLFSRFPELTCVVTVPESGAVLFGYGRERLVRANRSKLLKQLNLPYESLTLGKQVHGSTVRFVGYRDRGSGTVAGSYLPQTDGLVTTSPGVTLGVYAADCVPVFAYDPSASVIGVAHAGWRGIVRGIVPGFVRTLERAGASLSSTRVWLGPSVHSCCYNVTNKRDNRIRLFGSRYGTRSIARRNSEVFLNLQYAVSRDLVAGGVRRRHIEVDDTCTVHDHRALPSAVREKTARKRSLLGCIAIRDPLDELKRKPVLVFGLGVHGGGADTARWFARHGARVTVTDRQSKDELSASLKRLRGLPIRYTLGTHSFGDVRATRLIVLNPGVPLASPYVTYARELRKPLECDASIFFTKCRTDTVIGVTGTKGKTTTTALIDSMLRTARRQVVAVGHNEVPLLGSLDRISKRTTVVAELSSWRLDGLTRRRLSPAVAVITNIMPDHLDRYGSLLSYARSKEIIVAYQRSDDIAILNRDDSLVRRIGSRVLSQRRWFSLRFFPEENGAYLHNGAAYLREEGGVSLLLTRPKLQSMPPHAILNALAASLAARAVGVPLAAIRSAIQRFGGIPHRLELVATLDGVRYINDSAATTPEAALAAFDAVPGRIVLIGGGSDKRLAYHALGTALSKRCRSVILFDGSATRKLLTHLIDVPVSVVGSMRRAVRLANALAEPGDTVLLSPGAASFGVFKHEFDRGDQFRRTVRELIK